LRLAKLIEMFFLLVGKNQLGAGMLVPCTQHRLKQSLMDMFY
jgi:hypothetical protein